MMNFVEGDRVVCSLVGGLNGALGVIRRNGLGFWGGDGLVWVVFDAHPAQWVPVTRLKLA